MILAQVNLFRKDTQLAEVLRERKGALNALP